MAYQQDEVKKSSVVCKLKSVQNNTVVALMPLLLGGCLVIASQSLVKAEASNEPFVVAQSIINGLPPPPDYPQQGNQRLPPNPPSSQFREREYNFQAPPSRSLKSNSQGYRVYIQGDNRVLLQQIRNIDPEAFVRQGEGVIQAGLYYDKARAEQRARELQNQGFTVAIMPIGNNNSDFVRRDSGFTAGVAPVSNNNSEYIRRDSSFFVIIPGRKSDLSSMASQLIALGLTSDSVVTRQGPRGAHIAVGPFIERSQAERWSNYLRSYNLDARVYFGR